MKAGIPISTLLIAGAALLSGCGNMSGLDAQTSFSCKAPAGVSCQSVSGTYANSVQDNLPFQQQRRHGAEFGDKPQDESKVVKAPLPPPEKAVKMSPRDMDVASSGIPIRQPPLVLRVWVAPYEDEAGDLHDQSYFYTMVHSGKWMIEANRTKISNTFRPVFPLKQRGGEEGKERPMPQVGAGTERVDSESAGERPNYARPQQPGP